MSHAPVVSIVIPAYNAAAFMGETLASILAQTFSNFEIIVINDGSIDDTEGVVKSFSDNRIHYAYKPNEGVSIARNTGFSFSKGDYIVFFDADDLMTPDFLEKRLEVLESHKEIDFCCGTLEFFPIHKEQIGACDDIPSEILLYNQQIETCPSNYMFRRNVVEQVKFHPQLSSTADRFFLLQVAKIAKGSRVEGGKLKYRISAESMSAQLNLRWLEDNELFYTLLSENNLIPSNIAGEVFLKKYYILSISYLKIRNYKNAIKTSIKYFQYRFILERRCLSQR